MFRYSSAQYPLSPEEFRRALSIGLGRALLHSKQCGLTKNAEDVFQAAVDCTVYDPQSEGYPAPWIADLCVAAGVAEKVIEAPLPLCSDSRNLQLRCALMKQFAERGSSHARSVLYSACIRDEATADVYACEEIVELDGREGLLFVAQRLGQFLAEDADFWVDSDLLEVFDSTAGVGSGRALLDRAASSDADVRRYLEALSLSADPERPPSAREGSFEDTFALIVESQRNLFWLSSWSRKLGPLAPRQLTRLVQLALGAATPIVKRNALRGIAGSPQLPVLPELIPLLRYDDEFVRFFAAKALGQCRSPSVRQAGLELLSQHFGTALETLRSSALPEDAARIHQALIDQALPEDLHEVVYPIVKLLSSNRTLDPSLLSLFVYFESPCSRCRADAVAALVHGKCAPQWLLQEALHDAFPAVRDACVA